MPRLKFRNCDYDCEPMRDKRGTFRVYCRRTDKKCKIIAPSPIAMIEPWQLRFDQFKAYTILYTIGTGKAKIGRIIGIKKKIKPARGDRYERGTHNISPVRAKKEAYLFEVENAIKSGKPVPKKSIADYHKIKKEFISKQIFYGLGRK